MAQDVVERALSAGEIKPPSSWDEYFTQITYKPKHVIYCDYDIINGFDRVVIVRPVEDTYNRGNVISVITQYVLPNWNDVIRGDVEYADHFMRDVFHKMEEHEADEWFRRNGVMLFDPHAHEGIWGN